VIDRLGGDVRRELGRFGPAAGMEPIVESWPAAVGVEIARNAWPARLARDGTLHVHTKDSIWAFELKSRAEEIRGRLGAAAPPRLSFAPGPLPEPLETEPAGARSRVAEPSAEHVAKADSLVRVIRDEDLRKVVAKAVALGLANGDNDRSFW
jgi:predicted nucleic acid-binding Zn ribbon protein